MSIDLRKENECRIELHKHLKENEILYGEVSPNLLIVISDFLLEWENKKDKTKDFYCHDELINNACEDSESKKCETQCQSCKNEENK